jgi:cytochrome c oxidase cbb3-type subunit 4
MDLNDIRSLVTVISLLLFIALMAWTWRPSRKQDHNAAANLPFEGDSQSPDSGAPQ